MISKPKRFAGLAAAVLAAGALAACSSSSTSSPSTSASSSTPVSGGTLNIISASGPDHIDTVPAYYTVDYQLEHAYTRQLLQYPTVPYTGTSGAGWTATTTPAADVATEVPTVANGGITNGGKTYTFHIKPGVDWNTSPPRQVTSQDFLREFKAFFNPVSPVGNPVYYEARSPGSPRTPTPRPPTSRSSQTRRPRRTSPTSRTRTASPASRRRTRRRSSSR